VLEDHDADHIAVTDHGHQHTQQEEPQHPSPPICCSEQGGKAEAGGCLGSLLHAYVQSPVKRRKECRTLRHVERAIDEQLSSTVWGFIFIFICFFWILFISFILILNLNNWLSYHTAQLWSYERKLKPAPFTLRDPYSWHHSSDTWGRSLALRK
jgi:hypothetical protein